MMYKILHLPTALYAQRPRAWRWYTKKEAEDVLLESNCFAMDEDCLCIWLTQSYTYGMFWGIGLLVPLIDKRHEFEIVAVDDV